ncbi:acyl-CoA dehydrogenase family protein [Nocardioides convexus]|uniref:acyl-CoA dehydrogenase family protein n=1 Tax=Nocardioides convexus TaxID=2712224 RepID=UPI002418A0DC|nr:acyl-CoA dehydrogenase family protein [Nocardioides convexus]
MDRLLGGERALDRSDRANDGRESARGGFVMERVACAIGSLGIIEECHRRCVAYAKQREPVGQADQRVPADPAGSSAKMEVARLNVQNMVFVALDAIKAGRLPTLAQASAMKALLDRGGHGRRDGGGPGSSAATATWPSTASSRLARDAKSLMIYAGSNEIQVTHVAKGLLAARPSTQGA